MRAELFGRRSDLLALLGIFEADWTVGDLGCGTGEVAGTVAPFVKRVVAVDSSRAMLAAARKRLAGVPNVELRQGDLDGLPVDKGELDVALLFHVLQYVIEPATALRAVRRTLAPDGRAVLLDMMPHERDEYRQQMGHVWHGFSRDQLSGWLEEAGFTAVRYTELPPDPQAKGPSLFVATATA
jgi:ArsR family transcriptional regulator